MDSDGQRPFKKTLGRGQEMYPRHRQEGEARRVAGSWQEADRGQMWIDAVQLQPGLMWGP